MRSYMIFQVIFSCIGKWFVYIGTNLPFFFEIKTLRSKSSSFIKKSNPFYHQLLPIFGNHKKDLCKQIS